MLGSAAKQTGAIETMDACILAMIHSMALMTRCATSEASCSAEEFVLKQEAEEEKRQKKLLQQQKKQQKNA